MLVLSRKEKQRIVIGENVELVVLAVLGDRVKLGFTAPSNVPIHREEVHRRIQSENRDADANSCDDSADNPSRQFREQVVPVLDS